MAATPHGPVSGSAVSATVRAIVIKASAIDATFPRPLSISTVADSDGRAERHDRRTAEQV
ncbi:MAG: hypothetical protein IPG34_19525 [Rhodocyclaceae bacterium]|nr:hypothetical protein [Rhodocyclaceae bacterium]